MHDHELRIRNWEKWQSYRRDRGQPPWIKVHREVMRNPDWVALTDAQRGQLVAIWLLAADRDGVIPASPDLIRKLCYMDENPDLQLFVRLGFIEDDVTVTPGRRQDDASVTALTRSREAEAEAEHTHRTRGREADGLREWLGPHAEAVAGVQLISDPEVCDSLYQQFGPPGMQARAWATPAGDSLPEPERPRLLASAISGYAAEGHKRFVIREFSGLLRGMIADETSAGSASPGRSTLRASGAVVTDDEFERMYGRPGR